MESEELRLIMNYVDRINPKFELNGAYLDMKNKKIVATNTRVLIVYDNEDLKVDGIIQRQALELALKGATAKREKQIFFHNRTGNKHSLMGSGNLIDIQADDVIISTAGIIGTFPDYERVMFDPDSKDVTVVVADHAALYRDVSKLGAVLNYDYVLPFIKYLKLRNYDATIYYKAPEVPVMIKCHNFTLLVMPIILDK